jgi:hypothetical protein
MKILVQCSQCGVYYSPQDNLIFNMNHGVQIPWTCIECINKPKEELCKEKK